MKVQPVATYSAPRYPTRLEILDDPDLLLRHQPAGWKRVPGIATALACFLTAEGTLLSSCKGASPDHGASAQAAADIVAPSSSDAGATAQAAAGLVAADAGSAQAAGNLVVAPLSKHGEGRGALGCVVTNPPDFLSEDEAFVIIEQELAKHGVKLTNPTEGWEQVQVDRACTNSFCSTEPYRMIPDGEDKAEGVAVEFIGQEDHRDLMGRAFSIEPFDFVAASNHLRSQLALAANSKRPRTYVGVFYEPLAPGRVRACEQQYMLGKLGIVDHEKLAQCFDRHRDVLQRNAAAMTKEDLRKQVADFAAWLKGQGVL